MIRSLFRQFGLLLAEQRCAACGRPVDTGLSGTAGPVLCPVCGPALARRTGGFCDRCGAVSARPDAPPAPCGQCLARPRPWRGFFLHGAYEGLLRDLLLRFKHNRELPLGALLGGLLAAHPALEPGAYDAIIPMPLHPRRLRERGFNQSLELARPLAERTGAPLAPDLLLRAAHTVPQTRLHDHERRNNVRGIFRAAGAARGKRALLVDDIATTGATMEEAVKTLLAAGAARVDAIVAARTPGRAAH